MERVVMMQVAKNRELGEFGKGMPRRPAASPSSPVPVAPARSVQLASSAVRIPLVRVAVGSWDAPQSSLAGRVLGAVARIAGIATRARARAVARARLAGVAKALAVATGLAGIPAAATALDEVSAARMVETMSGEIFEIVGSDEPEDVKIRKFEHMFLRYADARIMARYSLGADARRATPAQLRAYTEVFGSFMSRKYGSRFRELLGTRVEFDPPRAIKAGFEVRTEAHFDDGDVVEVIFLLSDKSGEDKVFNIFVEGVNMLLYERTEIAAMLDARGGDLDQLIADMRASDS